MHKPLSPKDPQPTLPTRLCAHVRTAAADSSTSTMLDAKPDTSKLFAYGTLMVPAIVSRVLGRDISDLTFQDAVLAGYSRHHIRERDYPAIVAAGQLGLGPSDASVRGTLIAGLGADDMRLLDVFEADEYRRAHVTVALLGDAARAPEYRSGAGIEAAGSARAEAYVWQARLAHLLERAEWSFDAFVRDKADAWAQGRHWEFDDVERARALAPGAAPPPRIAIDAQHADGLPDFGRAMRRYWKFRDGYINLNHGSYGTPPRAVLDAKAALSDEIEGAPDVWIRRRSEAALADTRAAVAPLLGAREEDVVLVPNATHGINNVLQSIEWNDGDVVVCYASTYNAVSQGLKYVCDRHAGVRLEVIPVTFPTTHAAIVEATAALFRKYNHSVPRNYDALTGTPAPFRGERVRLVVVDSIASAPGVVYPWRAVVALARRYRVLSLVDGAHSIGQERLDVPGADPDFFVSNCHKWLMSHRGGAVLWVPARNQALVRATFPVGHFYESSRYPTPGGGHPWAWQKQYDWNGTIDFTPIVTIQDAIRFRNAIGGEDRIMAYCHDLAVKGGAYLAHRWRTEVMDNAAGELTAAMVNVRLPLPPVPRANADVAAVSRFLEDQMLFAYNCAAAVYPHNGAWWTRLSAQVWNDLADFEHVGTMFEEIADKVRNGEHAKAKL